MAKPQRTHLVWGTGVMLLFGRMAMLGSQMKKAGLNVSNVEADGTNCREGLWQIWADMWQIRVVAPGPTSKHLRPRSTRPPIKGHWYCMGRQKIASVPPVMLEMGIGDLPVMWQSLQRYQGSLP